MVPAKIAAASGVSGGAVHEWMLGLTGSAGGTVSASVYANGEGVYGLGSPA